MGEVKNEKTRRLELTFDSQRKSMTSIHQEEGKQVAYVKGAPKKIIKLSPLISDDGTVRPFTDREKEKVFKIHDKLAASGLRILAMAYRDLPPVFDDYQTGSVEQENRYLWVRDQKYSFPGKSKSQLPADHH